MPPRLSFNPYICMEFDSFLFSSVGTDRDKVDAKGLKLTNNNNHHVLRTPHICMYCTLHVHMSPYAQYFIYIRIK